MLSMEKPTREIAVTLPKPLAHLVCHLINIMFEGVVEGRDELTKILCPCSRYSRLALYPIQVAHQR